MKQIKTDADCPYPIYSAHVSSLSEIEALTFPSRYFTLLVCADFKSASVRELSSVARRLIQLGNLWFAAWGDGCERGHDIYDETLINLNVESPEIMTTWHDGETLADALWFILFVASVQDDHWDRCSTIIVTVGDKDWESEIDVCLENVSAFNELVLQEE